MKYQIQYNVDFLLVFKYLGYGCCWPSRREYEAGFHSSESNDNRERACSEFGTWIKVTCMEHVDLKVICYNSSTVT